MKRNLILIGLPGSGKSTVGALLAKALGCPLLDTDEMIVRCEGRSIPAIFAAEGEDYFRCVETACAREAAAARGAVIATGGGIVLRPENMEALQESGFICFLDRSADEIARGLDISGRPLLAEGREKIFRLAQERDALYRRYADAAVSEKTPRAAAQAALRAFRAANKNESSAKEGCGMEPKKLCVIGDPVAHSLSPVIHGAMLRALDLPYTYGRVQVRAGETADFLRRAVGENYAGFNATMPHKTDLVPLCDELDEDAQLYRAVNTVVLRDGTVRGCNTDGRGFLQMLLAAGISPEAKTITVLGAGGAARAVALKLAQSGAEHIFVCNRTREKAEALAAEFPLQITPCPFDAQTLRECALFSDLLINTTPMGMTGVTAQFESLDFLEALPQGAAVCDAIYSPPETPLLARARALGHPTLNGLGMLIYQAIFALEEFTGTAIDPPTVLPAVYAALNASE